MAYVIPFSRLLRITCTSYNIVFWKLDDGYKHYARYDKCKNGGGAWLSPFWPQYNPSLKSRKRTPFFSEKWPHTKSPKGLLGLTFLTFQQLKVCKLVTYMYQEWRNKPKACLSRPNWNKNLGILASLNISWSCIQIYGVKGLWHCRSGRLANIFRTI